MCIIAAKPAGIAMPNHETLVNMWEHNPDGAGFMYSDKGRVHIEKGFMSLKDFLSALDLVGKQVDLKASGVVMHFRIATHGGVSAANTHPFPISTNLACLRKPVYNADIAVAHNGIIHSVTPRDKNTSDTAEFVASVLAPLYKSNPKFYADKNLMQMIDTLAGSKLAFLLGDGSIHTIGRFEKCDGIMYSNTSYESYTWGRYWNSSPKLVPYSSTWSQSKDAYGWESCYTRMLMPIDAIDGAFYVTKDGEMIEAEWDDVYLDVEGGIWMYDTRTDLCVKDTDFIAGVYDKNGNHLRYDPEYALLCDCELDDPYDFGEG